MRVVIVTPIHALYVPYVSALADSFEFAGIPSDVDVAWRVQVDGEDKLVADRVDEMVESARTVLPVTVGWVGRRRGPAYCRNVAVLESLRGAGGRAVRGDVVVSIDADDFWLPGGLETLLGPFRNPICAWAVGGHVTANEVGETGQSSFPGVIGFVPPGGVRRTWEESGTFPITASCAAWRVRELLSVGGWPATPTGEDAALMMAFSDRFTGFSVKEPLFGYRQHPVQSTKSTEHQYLRGLTQIFLRATAATSDSSFLD